MKKQRLSPENIKSALELLKKGVHYFMIGQTKATNPEYVKFVEKELNKLIDKSFPAFKEE